jgi:hypothetical protein
MTLNRELGDPAGEAMVSHQLGLVALMEGDRPRAVRLLADALGRQHELEDHQDVAVSLDTLAHAVVADDAAMAAELLGAAETVRRDHGLAVPPPVQAQRDETLAAARASLGADSSAAAQAAGRVATVPRIVERVRHVAGSPG